MKTYMRICFTTTLLAVAACFTGCDPAGSGSSSAPPENTAAVGDSGVTSAVPSGGSSSGSLINDTAGTFLLDPGWGESDDTDTTDTSTTDTSTTDSGTSSTDTSTTDTSTTDTSTTDSGTSDTDTTTSNASYDDAGKDVVSD
ncbi:MAG: hypothetical protein LBH00_03920 [Planctomycetaceae bacterium]|jgi:hypothetical protein|nr:hypothetical protein [Planctomycetaceae bacterium]